jgi:DNA (cytosine-5)-methyltransferase 1
MNDWKKHLPNIKFSKTINIGTDCSGIEAPLIALNELKIKYKHIFSSDNDKKCKELIEKHYHPIHFYDSIFEKNYKELKKYELDLYICGFPCQTFSIAGKQDGFYDSRGIVFFECLKTIKLLKPKIFILENVKNLKSHNNGNTFSIIMNELKNIKMYNIYYEILNTNDFGIPQNRPRLYIVGIAKSHMNKKLNYEFPKKINCVVSFDSFFEKNLPISELSNNQKKILEKMMINKDYNKNYIINLGVSLNGNFGSAMLEKCPCLLASQCYYYSTKFKRFLTIQEWARFQGIHTHIHYNFKQLGNTMSVNVLCFLFHSILHKIF